MYILIRRYHKRYHGEEPPELYATLDDAKQASDLPGPWEPVEPKTLTASGDNWDARIYERFIQRVPHEPRGLTRFPRCRIRPPWIDDLWIT